MERLICLLIGYMFGLIQTGYIYGKINNIDIRTLGSGNAGTTNALRTLGWKAGVITFIGDCLKCVVAVLLVRFVYRNASNTDLLAIYTGLGAVLGHNFPFYLKFKGGKGLACLGGVILAFDWRYFLMILVIETVFVIIVNYICFVPMTASIVFPISYAIIRHDIIGALILLIPAVVIFVKHTENIKRIYNGTEVRISFLWNKKGEVDRVTNNQKNNIK